MDAATTLQGERYYYRFEDLDDNSAIERNVAEADSIPSLESYEKPPAGHPNFWRRQFGEVVTAKQRKFDWFMGVILPMVCFYFDPIVFRSEFENDGLLLNYQLPAYVLAFSAIMAQTAWLLWGERLGQLKFVVGLTLSVAAVAAMLIGIIIFPFSLIGMLLLIGVLGFTPIFTAIVYWRTAVRAMRTTSVN